MIYLAPNFHIHERFRFLSSGDELFYFCQVTINASFLTGREDGPQKMNLLAFIATTGKSLT